MEQLKQNKYYRWCLSGFILVTCIFLFYSSVTMRGMYMDGSFLMTVLLNKFANNQFSIAYDPGHPRYSVWILTQFPVIFANYLGFHSKTFLMMFYSFTTLALPPFLLFLHYKLAKKTNRIDLFFWSLFVYCLFSIMYSIFSIVESPPSAIWAFMLFNYLVADIEYKKIDIFNIILLILLMSNSSEFFLFIGPILFLSSFYYAYKSENVENSIIKISIGFSSLLATIYMFVYTLFVDGEVQEGLRFLGEALDYLPYVLSFCPLISIGALILLICAFFINKKMNNLSFGICVCFISALFIRLIMTLNTSLNPVMEGHLRTIPFALIPLIILGVFIFDIFKGKINEIKFQNYFCIVLICGIAQTSWQLVNTYFWDRNVNYLKQSLFAYDKPLYFPSEHPPISSFWDENLHRYIWHSVYVPSSIIFSDTYEINPLLMPYDEEFEKGNLTFNNYLRLSDNENIIMIPMGTIIDVKNRYWDLTKVVEALREYSKEQPKTE